MQAFPQVLEHVHMAVDVLDALRQQGPVDIKEFSSRLTAGKPIPGACQRRPVALSMSRCLM